jgi:hypothetical protein
LVSCGKVSDILYKDGEPERKVTHSDFVPYLKALEKDLGKVGVPIVYGKAKEDERWVGVCYKWRGSSYREIAIDSKYWAGASESARYQLLLHEIGHCKYDRGHDDSYSQLDQLICPNSVMTTYVFSSEDLFDCFDPNFDYYVNEIK